MLTDNISMQRPQTDLNRGCTCSVCTAANGQQTSTAELSMLYLQAKAMLRKLELTEKVQGGPETTASNAVPQLNSILQSNSVAVKNLAFAQCLMPLQASMTAAAASSQHWLLPLAVA